MCENGKGVYYMVFRIRKNDALIYSFYGLLLFSVIGYAGYYWYTFYNGITVYNSFSATSIGDIPTLIVASIIRFFKDFLLLCIFFLYMMKSNKSIRRKLLVFSAFILCGAFVALLSGYYASIMGGVRGYLYFFILLVFFSEMKPGVLSLNVIKNIIYIGIIINFLVITEQTLRGTGGLISLVGAGVQRYMGLFGGWAPCSAFAAAACLFFYVYSTYYTWSKLHIGIAVICSLFIEFMCGSRSGMMCVLLIMYVWFLKSVPVKRIYKYLAIISTLGIVLMGVIKFVEAFADRGSILEIQMQSGRIMILNQVLNSLWQNPITFLLGNGLGAGSNTSTLMSNFDYNLGAALVLDGTLNTVLYQYGMFGAVVLLFFLLMMWIKMRNVLFDLKLVFWLIVFIEGITSNLFECFACQIILFITYILMCKGQFFSYDTNNSRVISG